MALVGIRWEPTRCASTATVALTIELGDRSAVNALDCLTCGI